MNVRASVLNVLDPLVGRTAGQVAKLTELPCDVVRGVLADLTGWGLATYAAPRRTHRKGRAPHPRFFRAPAAQVLHGETARRTVRKVGRKTGKLAPLGEVVDMRAFEPDGEYAGLPTALDYSLLTQ